MTDGPLSLPGDLKHLERLLDRWSRQPEVGVTAGRLRRLVGVTVIAGMLDGLRDDTGTERIVFKGGSALELRFGLTARASQDLDTAYRGALDEALTLVGQALAQDWNGFTGTARDPEEILRPGIVPAPRRITIRLRYRGRPFVTIPFEVSAAEGRSLDQPERLPSAVALEPVQLPDPPTIAFLPLRYQIAQKLHACTEDLGSERTNNRVRDLHDLLLIKALAVTPAALPAIRAACEEIFAGRHAHPWPPTLTSRDGWNVLWDQLVTTEGIELTLDQAVTAVNDLIASIATATPAGTG